MSEETMQRQPCPWRIADDAGGAFVMGAVIGMAYNGFKGYRSGPRGLKFREATQAVKIRAPVMAGSFGAWGLCFSSFDCAITHIRGKEDPWNAISSGALTGGVLAARLGPKPALQSAFFGGVVLAAIEGLTIVMNRYATQQNNPVAPAPLDDPLGPLPAPPPPGAGQRPAGAGI